MATALHRCSALLAGTLALTSAAAAPPDAQAALLLRLQAVEAQIAQAVAEAARLRAELTQAAQPAPAAAPAAAKPIAADEWGAPEVARKPEGRDDEARRRLMALETQQRKSAAEAARREQEAQGRTRWELSAKYKVRFNSRNNFNLDNPLQEWRFDNDAFVDHRFQLGIDAARDELSAKLVLDKGNFVFDWKEDSEGTLERWGEFQTVTGALVREMYAQYTGPVMVRVGRQSWDVAGIVLEGPMDSLRVQAPLGRLPWGQTTLGAGYLSIAGGWRSYEQFGAGPAGDRSELLYASNKLDGYYLDLEVRPARGVQIKPYLLVVHDRGGATDADLNLDKDFNAATTPRDGHFNPRWLGLSTTAQLGSTRLDAQLAWLRGSISARQRVQASAVVLQAEHDFGRVGAIGRTSAGLQWGRGSGDGAAGSDGPLLRNFNALFLCRDRHKFGNIFSEDIRAGYFMWDSNLSNISYLRLNAMFEPAAALRITPALTFVRTTQPVFAGHGPVFDWSKGGTAAARLSRDVGWEADLDATAVLTRHLEAFLALAYFRPGAVYARPDGTNPRAAVEAVVGAEFTF